MSLFVTRFAPSPTGHLHIGGARTALFCWAQAARAGRDGHDGHFMIRVEDTDQARSSDESARGILDDLAWLGIEWTDGPELAVGAAEGARTIGGDPRRVGPFFQARRVHLYNAYIDFLMSIGRAYPAFESSEQLESLRKAAVARKETFRYPRPGDIRFGVAAGDRIARAKAGEPHVVRFVMDDLPVVVHDTVLGDVRTAPGEVDDFVLRKADGFPTYHFAVVIDDELMGVTHVLRAQDHLTNTPKHVGLQRALRRLDNDAPFRTPIYGHVPLIFNTDGTKMSKREKAKTARKAAKDAIAKDKSITAASLAASVGVDGKLMADFLAGENDSLDAAVALGAYLKVALPEISVWDYRQNGYLPGAIVNFLALLGWNPGLKTADGKDLEKFDRQFLADHFSVERIGRTNAKFDRAKLLSFNADAIAALSDEAFLDAWLGWLREHEPAVHAKIAGLDAGRRALLAHAVKPRARTLRDALRPSGFALVGDDGYEFDAAAVGKNLRASGGLGLRLLRDARSRLESLADAEWQPGLIHSLVEQLAQQSGAGMGPVSQAIRVAVTGAGVSPGVGETLAILGRASAMRRIDRCLSVFSS